MVTTEQAVEFLSGQGIEMPDFILDALFEMVDGVFDCLTSNGAAEGVKALIVLNLLGMLALGMSDNRVNSQRAPNGAAQSFKLESVGQRFKAMRGIIRMLDKWGCTDGMIPPNPDAKSAGLWISPGVGQEGC